MRRENTHNSNLPSVRGSATHHRCLAKKPSSDLFVDHKWPRCRLLNIKKAGPRTALPFPPWRLPSGPVAAF